MLDLATCFNDDGSEKPDSKHVDLSGRPAPKGVRAILNSGIEIECSVRYDGHSTIDKRKRRFVIFAEIDWRKYNIERLILGEWPMDAEPVLKFPDTGDTELQEHIQRMHATMKISVEKTV